MKISIDGRMLVDRNITGTQRYTIELINFIKKVFSKEAFFVLLNKGIKSSDLKYANYLKESSNLFENGIDVFHKPFHVETYKELFELLTVDASIITVYDLIAIKRPDYYLNLDFHKQASDMMRLSLDIADKIICVSEYTKSQIRSIYNVPDDKIEVVYHGIDRQRFKKIKDETKISNFKKQYNIDEKVILYLGTDFPHKNLKNLYLAFDKIIQNEITKDYQLVIGGNRYNTKRDAELKKVLDKLKDKIRFLGFIDDEQIPLLYNCADIFVFPSLDEGFGFPVLEAFACEVPVVCSDVASLPEVAGDAAFTVDVAKPENIVQAILKISEDETLRKKLIEKGKKRTEMFTWEKSVKNTFDVYKKVISEKSKVNNLQKEAIRNIFSFLLKNEMIKNKLPIHGIKDFDKLIKVTANNIRNRGLIKTVKKIFRKVLNK